MADTDDLVMPLDTEYFTEIFEKYAFNFSSKPVEQHGELPIVKLNDAEITVGGLCLIHLYPNGRKYMWVRPSKKVLDFLEPRLRIKEKSNVFFDIVMRQNDKTGKVVGLVRAVQGNDWRTPHSLALIRGDSIPEETDGTI